MRAAQLRVDVSAHNVANGQTPDFQRQAVTQTAQGERGGVQAQVTRETGARRNADFGALAEDLVNQRMAVYSFAANLRTVQTQDAMLGALLDERA